MMVSYTFRPIAEDLELAGLLWQPEIGDEISLRENPESLSVLVNPDGLTPAQLRNTYIWLPTLEQMILQFEARQAMLCHVGFEMSEQHFCYRTVIQSALGKIESQAQDMRISVGLALRDLLIQSEAEVH